MSRKTKTDLEKRYKALGVMYRALERKTGQLEVENSELKSLVAELTSTSGQRLVLTRDHPIIRPALNPKHGPASARFFVDICRIYTRQDITDNDRDIRWRSISGCTLTSVGAAIFFALPATGHHPGVKE